MHSMLQSHIDAAGAAVMSDLSAHFLSSSAKLIDGVEDVTNRSCGRLDSCIYRTASLTQHIYLLLELIYSF